jgi:polar amino acid transport system substrate-binding protein
MRAIRPFLAVTIAAAVITACGRSEAPDAGPAESASAGSECSLTMGWDPWEPYHYMDPTGELSGFDIQVVRALADSVGCRVEFRRESWADLLNHVASGDVDLISGATLTEDRERFAIFSDPYRSEEFALYVRSGAATGMGGSSLRELLEGGLRIGVTDAYLYGDEVTALQDDPAFASQFVAATMGEISATRLLDGEIDGFIEDIFVATAAIRRRGLENDIAVYPLALQSGGDVRFMFSRASVEEGLVRRIDAALAELRESGRYKEIEDRYLR